MMSCGFLLPSQSRSPASTVSPSRTRSLRPIGTRCLYSLLKMSLTTTTRLPFTMPRKATMPRDRRQDGRGLGLARLEELADARQAARDVHGLGALLERLGQSAARLHQLAVLDVEVGAAREEVGHDLVARLVGDDYARLLGVALGRELGDLLLDVARFLVDLLLQGGTGDDVLVADIAVVLGDDRVGEGIESGERAVGRDDVAGLHDDLGAVAHVDLLVLRDEEDAARAGLASRR